MEIPALLRVRKFLVFKYLEFPAFHVEGKEGDTLVLNSGALWSSE